MGFFLVTQSVDAILDTGQSRFVNTPTITWDSDTVNNTLKANAANTAPLWNANKLQGLDISTVLPANDQILRWNATTSEWEPVDISLPLGTISPTTTTGNITAIAFSEALNDNTTYIYDARVVARRTDASGDHADFQILAKVRRENGGVAAIIGSVFQKRRSSTDAELQVDWNVSGNNVELQVTGATGKTINWQPQIEREAVT